MKDMNPSERYSNMGNFKMAGDWDMQTKSIRNQHPRLTTLDLRFEDGKEKELIMRMGMRLNKNTADIINILKRHQP